VHVKETAANNRVFAQNILIIFAGKSIYNFVSNLTWVWWIHGWAGEGTDGRTAGDS